MPLQFSPKTPDAVIIYGGDFTLQLDQRPEGTTIDEDLVSCYVTAAEGDLPGTLGLNGGAFLTGNVVSQIVSGGTPGATYTLEFRAPLSNGETLAGTVTLPVSLNAPP